MALVGEYDTVEDIKARLDTLDRSLMQIKRNAAARFGRRRSLWPPDVLDEIARRKAIAIKFRAILKSTGNT